MTNIEKLNNILSPLSVAVVSAMGQMKHKTPLSECLYTRLVQMYNAQAHTQTKEVSK